jgi:hypothetical protein
MRRHKKQTLTVLAALFAALVAVFLAARSEGQNKQKAKKNSVVILRRQDQLKSMPTGQEIAEAKQKPADYAAPEPADPVKRDKRRAKSKRYDRQGMVAQPNSRATGAETQRIASWMHKAPALPVEMSDAIVIGEITDAQSYLSNDKSGVYTEFTVRIGQALKNDNAAPLALNATLVAQREGGRVQFPSGRIQRYTFHFQGMPHTGSQYVLFLKRNEDGESYYIRTGYELRAGRAFPLDGVDLPPGATELPQFAAYKDVDEATFLSEVRAAIVNPSTGNKGR